MCIDRTRQIKNVKQYVFKLNTSMGKKEYTLWIRGPEENTQRGSEGSPNQTNQRTISMTENDS